jgi:hypothetical protein
MALLPVSFYSLFLEVDRPDDGLTNEPKLVAATLCS